MDTSNSQVSTEKRRRGFAVMDAEQRRKVARAGGLAAHRKGAAHEFSPDEARAAGKKGGETVSRNRAHMSLIGRKGGVARAARAKIAAAEPPTDEGEVPIAPVE